MYGSPDLRQAVKSIPEWDHYEEPFFARYPVTWATEIHISDEATGRPSDYLGDFQC